jgi:hypothetical protein
MTQIMTDMLEGAQQGREVYIITPYGGIHKGVVNAIVRSGYGPKVICVVRPSTVHPTLVWKFDRHGRELGAKHPYRIVWKNPDTDHAYEIRQAKHAAAKATGLVTK